MSRLKNACGFRSWTAITRSSGHVSPVRQRSNSIPKASNTKGAKNNTTRTENLRNEARSAAEVFAVAATVSSAFGTSMPMNKSLVSGPAPARVSASCWSVMSEVEVDERNVMEIRVADDDQNRRIIKTPASYRIPTGHIERVPSIAIDPFHKTKHRRDQ